MSLPGPGLELTHIKEKEKYKTKTILSSDLYYKKKKDEEKMTAIQTRPGIHWKKSQEGYLFSLGSRQQEEFLELFLLAFHLVITWLWEWGCKDTVSVWSQMVVSACFLRKYFLGLD